MKTKISDIRAALKDIDFRDSMGMQAAAQLEDYDYCIKHAITELLQIAKMPVSHTFRDKTIKQAIQQLVLARILNTQEIKELALLNGTQSLKT